MGTSGQESGDRSNLSWSPESCALTQEHPERLTDKSSGFSSIACVVYLWTRGPADDTFFACVFSPFLPPLGDSFWYALLIPLFLSTFICGLLHKSLPLPFLLPHIHSALYTWVSSSAPVVSTAGSRRTAEVCRSSLTLSGLETCVSLGMAPEPGCQRFPCSLARGPSNFTMASTQQACDKC